MPHYFFHVHDGYEKRDHEGVDLDNLAKAKQHAVLTAGQIISDSANTNKLGEDWSMDVEDHQGLILFHLDFFVSAPQQVDGQAQEE